MATTSNVTILYGEDSQLNKVHSPVASGTVLARGDLLEHESNAVTVVDAAGDNVTFIGVSLDLSQNGETEQINVLLRGIINIGVSSTTYSIGHALKYNAGANGTDWILEKATSGADGIAWSMQDKTANVTSLNVYFDSMLIGTALGSGGALWEGFAS